MPPNSQGITALMALNVLSSPRLADGPDALRRPPARADRGDQGRLERARPMRRRPGPRPRAIHRPCCRRSTRAGWRRGCRRMRAHRFTPTNPPGGGTVYLCAADADGMMVSLIESNYMGFGSGIMGGSTGIMLQNRGAYFSLDPAHPNALAPALADAPHAHAGHAAARRPRRGGAWRDGRRRPAADDGPARHRPRRRRTGSAGARRSPALGGPTEAPGAPLGPVSLESDGWMTRPLPALRALGHEVTLVEPSTPLMGWAQVIRRRAGRLVRGRRRSPRRLARRRTLAPGRVKRGPCPPSPRRGRGRGRPCAG